ncbi:hypothetical protein C0J52_00760 [Blattella germanica]|nr:hypothetical protein C0J52_00760 [Blattella germanica]
MRRNRTERSTNREKETVESQRDRGMIIRHQSAGKGRQERGALQTWPLVTSAGAVPDLPLRQSGGTVSGTIFGCYQKSSVVAVSDLEEAESTGNTTRALQAVALILLAVVGSGSNTLVAIVFYRRPALRSPSNRFVLSLVLANLMTSLIVVPVLLVQVLHREMAALWWLRQASAGLTTFVVTSAIFSVLAIAVDRYNAVLSPLHYAMTITRQRSRAMIAGAWGVAGVLAVPPFLGALVSPIAVHPRIELFAANCTSSAEGEVFRLTYALVLVTLGFTLPLFALCWIYARMYNAAHRNSERTRRHSISANPGEQVVSSSRGGSLDLPAPPQSNGTPENFKRTWKNPPLSVGMPKRRCSNASISTLLFREEGRAVKTAAMVIASYLFCWTPYFVTLLVDTWGGVGAYVIEPYLVPEPFRSLALLTALSSGCITPFIYVFRNEAARSEAVKVLLWWRPGGGSKFGGNLARFDAYNCGGKPPPMQDNGFGPAPLHDNFSLRRQSLSYCDSISVQSFHIPTTTLSSSECRHCSDSVATTTGGNGPGTADFVATYEVVESPNEEETKATPTAVAVPPRTRRESVTFRLAFLPQRRCQTCIRQNSDSSSGSGHPLIRSSEGASAEGSFDCRTPPAPTKPPTTSVSSLMKMTVSQRRQQFLIGRQGSSGEELTPASEPETPRHVMLMGRRLMGPPHQEEDHDDSPKQLNNNNNNDPTAKKGGAVVLELEEQAKNCARPVPRSAAIFQVSLEFDLGLSAVFSYIKAIEVLLSTLQETSLERFTPLSASLENCAQDSIPVRQDSTHSDTTVRQDSNYSDVTVDSGVVADMAPFNRSHSSSSSISTASFSAPKRHRHKLQRLAAVEDEEAVTVAVVSPQRPPDPTPVPVPPRRTVKSRLKSSFKSRFYRPAFRIPKCDF